ncbi:hypothetical protein DSO57_1005566 [Entomophthora muscae]|uniref:Uncharacterized protein n=1 Tax=Entomophthora muscae TaxID=34485 RepID=A0ACC2UGU7_9FUNG|nr:hypothetical protein DSO57_1005566 [Entomophthora muscae]
MRIGLIVALVSAAQGLGTCSSDTLSCSSQPADSCCTPSIGRIVLAQQWIERLGPSDAFTLHGLWPNYCNGTYPPSTGCDSGRVYDNIYQLVQSDYELFPQMQKFWPSYKNDFGNFWTHEWTKHGTCLSTADPRCISEFTPGKDALAYFRMGLKTREKFDLYKALKYQGIVPGRSYPREDIINALAELGGKSILFCKGATINEIQSTFHVQGTDKFIMVDSSPGGNCPSTVIYPRKLPHYPSDMKLVDYSVTTIY